YEIATRPYLPGGAEEHVHLLHPEHDRSPRPRAGLCHVAQHAVVERSDESYLSHRLHPALAVHDRCDRSHLATHVGPVRGGQLHPDYGPRAATRSELARRPEHGPLGTDLPQLLVRL